jgi:hypothetical protein
MAAVWDPNADRAIVVGGDTFSDLCNQTATCGGYQLHEDLPTNEIWMMDGATGTWTRSYPIGSEFARVRGRHAMAFSTSLDEVLVFGGGQYMERVFDTPCNPDFSRTYLEDSWRLIDGFPPATPSVGLSADCEHIYFNWMAPGDDGSYGNASWFEVRRSTSPINDQNYLSLPIVLQGPSLPANQWQMENLYVGECTPYYYYALRVRDTKNWSGITTGGPIRTPCLLPHQVCDNSQPASVTLLPEVTELNVGPVPAVLRAKVGYALPPSTQGQPFQLAVFDALGRRVRTIVEGSATVGRHDSSWDLTTDAGAPARNGVYFVRLKVADRALLSRKLVVTR